MILLKVIWLRLLYLFNQIYFNHIPGSLFPTPVCWFLIHY